MNFRIYIFCLLATLVCGKEPEEQYRRLPDAIAVVGRTFEYFIPPCDEIKQQYKVTEQGKTALPKWLSFDADKNQLHGLPLWRDKGKVEIEVHLSNSQMDKAIFSIDVQDLHTILGIKSMISNETRVPPITEPQCSHGMPVAVATVQFDLHVGNLCGGERMNLMRKLSNFADVNMADLYMSVGKGHGTAFGFNDVMMITAGPGSVADPKKPGIVVSWKIGCGMDVAGMQVASLLKSSSEQGTFKQILDAPVSGWHIATGRPKAHQKRVRREASNPTPVPTQPLASSMRQIRQTATPTMTVAPPTSISATPTKVTPTATTPTNTKPEIKIPLRPMTWNLGNAFKYQIPEEMFYDAQDGSTRNLRLDLRTDSGQLPSSSWIQFDKDKQEIYGLASESELVGSHQFVLSATDTEGSSVSESFKVHVSESDTSYNTMFTICLNYDYKTLLNNVTIRLQLIRKITTYYGLELSELHVVRYYYHHGAIFFEFQFLIRPPDSSNCKSAFLSNIIDGFGSNNKQLNPNFRRALRPEFDVLYGFHEDIGPCAVAETKNTAPEINRAISQVNVYFGQGMRFVIPWDTFYDRQDFYTPSLKLEIRANDGKALSSTFWIYLNSSRQEIYGQPIDESLVRQHEFRIVAIDKGGLETFTNMEVVVRPDRNRYNHEFMILLKPDRVTYEDVAENAAYRVQLLEVIARYYKLNLTSVRIAKYVPGVSVNYRFDSIPYNDCENPLLKRIISGFWIHAKNELNESFGTALRDEDIPVLTGYYIGIGPCEHLTPDIISPPIEMNSISKKTVYQGQALYFHVPYNTFRDEQDFYTPNLRLSLRTVQSWIFLDPVPQDIYALPLDISTVKSHEFKLIAKDRKEGEGSSTFTVEVLKDTEAYNHKFAIRIDNYNTVKGDMVMRVKLLEKIASYYGLNYTNVRVLSETHDNTFTYRFDTVPAGQCNNTDLLKLINGFWSDKKMNPKFLGALSPDFTVISGHYQLLEPCKNKNTPPRLINPIQRQTVFEGQAMKFLIPQVTFYDNENGYTNNLKLTMTTTKGKNLPPSSWLLLFDSPKQEIKSLPTESVKIGLHKFYLTATDKGGFTASDEIEVEVMKDINIYNHRFTIVISDETVPDNVNSRVLFVEKLAAYFEMDLHDIRVRSYGQDVPTSFQFAIPNLKCDDSRLLGWKSRFMINGKLNVNFISALSPQFQVKSGSFEGLDICKPPTSSPLPTANTPPQLYNHIDRLNVFQGQGLRFLIPNDTFYDKEDGDTANLKLELKTIDDDKLLRTSWILLNSSYQEIYGLPSDIETIGLHEFLIVATDKEGSKAYDAFEVSVLGDENLYNHKFHILIDYSNVTFMDNVGVRVLLLEKIASYFSVNFTSVRVASYTPGVLFTFHFDFLPYEECSNPLLITLIDAFWLGEDLNPQFVSALGPDFRVISGSYEMLLPCKVVPDSKGVVGDRPGGIWWTYAIIPAIVLAVVLLIIGCCVLILMGCCRKQKLTGADRATFIYKRKPVVLQEEYEVKEMLLKQPTVLPNEKPPVPPVYPRSPVLGGDRTPLLMAETKSVPYQAPTVMSSKQMAGGGGGSSNAAFAVIGGGAGGGAGGGGGGADGSGAMVGGAGGGMVGGVGGGGVVGSGGVRAAGGGGGAGAFSAGGGAGGATGGGGAGGGGFSMASGGNSFKQTSYSYSYSGSSGGSVSGSSRKAGYSGYRLPPAYVPP